MHTRLSDEKLEILSNIKVIALDLDGTTLTVNGLTKRTKETLEEAISRGYTVLIATGRTYNSLPPKIHTIEGLEYIITSNGAHITDVKTGNFIYSDYIDEDSIIELIPLLKEKAFPIEVFTEGQAYVDKAVYDYIKENGSSFMNATYVLRTRSPIENIYGFLYDHKDKIENINIHFPKQSQKEQMKKALETFDNVTITSSFPSNIEIGGKNTSKATAISQVCKYKGYDISQVIAFGDSPNDEKMLNAAGFSVVMGNGNEQMKNEADFVAPTNNQEGVRYTIRRLLFNEAISWPKGRGARPSIIKKIGRKILKGFYSKKG